MTWIFHSKSEIFLMTLSIVSNGITLLTIRGAWNIEINSWASEYSKEGSDTTRCNWSKGEESNPERIGETNGRLSETGIFTLGRPLISILFVH